MIKLIFSILVFPRDNDCLVCCWRCISGRMVKYDFFYFFFAINVRCSIFRRSFVCAAICRSWIVFFFVYLLFGSLRMIELIDLAFNLLKRIRKERLKFRWLAWFLLLLMSLLSLLTPILPYILFYSLVLHVLHLPNFIFLIELPLHLCSQLPVELILTAFLPLGRSWLLRLSKRWLVFIDIILFLSTWVLLSSKSTVNDIWLPHLVLLFFSHL